MEKFKDITYLRPDLSALKKDISALIKQLAQAKTFEQADEVYQTYQAKSSSAITMYTVASIRQTMDVSDKFYETEVKTLSAGFAKLNIQMDKFTKLMLKSPFRQALADKYGEMIFINAENEKRLFNVFNIPDSIKEQNLTMQYSKIAATAKTEFEGTECNFYGLLKYMQSADRSVRQRAFTAWSKMYKSIALQIEEVYAKLIKIRCRTAKRLGFKSYIDYIYLARGRFDYTADDVANFRKQVKEIITPICAQLLEKQRERIGVDKMHIYDEGFNYPDGNADPIGTPEELIAKASTMYADISPETKEFFDFLTEHELYDLLTRPDKHMGGYCTTLPDYKAPFIFSNFNGTAADIQVLTHEAGHCFNAYLAMRSCPSLDTVHSTSEVNEIHSMAMELFTFPYWESFFGDKVDKARYCHLVDSLTNIPYMCVVDEFQHRVFENPKSTPDEWRKIWRSIEKEYMPWRDYDGDEFMESGAFWMQKQHIIMYPFYYIDYALAQTCAFQFFGRNNKNHKEAWDSYVKLCRAGGTYGYFKLLSLAGLDCPFKEGVVKQSVESVTSALEQMENK